MVEAVPMAFCWLTSTKRRRSAMSVDHMNRLAAAWVSCRMMLGTVETSALRPDSFSQSWITWLALHTLGPVRVMVWPTLRSLAAHATSMRAQSWESMYAMPGLEPSSPKTCWLSRTLTAYCEMRGCMKPLVRRTVYLRPDFFRNCSVLLLMFMSGTLSNLSQSLMLMKIYLWISIFSQHWMRFFLPSQSTLKMFSSGRAQEQSTTVCTPISADGMDSGRMRVPSTTEAPQSTRKEKGRSARFRIMQRTL
mmetsp:Transcript_74424/g.192028  ORF Transcript_74424/g.192028 Transcript_74424/m.192028 type:complete len:249 (+) Transcript_74424:595-1341(+)